MYNNYLQHHGILGMKWGVRRYQNPDGSLTPAGKKRYYATYDDSGQRISYVKRNRAERKLYAQEQKEKNAETKLQTAYLKNQTKSVQSLEKDQKKIYKVDKSIMKRTKTMSTAELQDRIAQLQAYKELKTLKRDTRSEGSKLVSDVLKQIGTKSLVQLGTTATIGSVYTALNKKFDREAWKKLIPTPKDKW